MVARGDGHAILPRMARRSRQARRTARVRAREWAGAERAGETGDPAAREAAAAGDGALPVCPLCERPIPPHARQSVHHFVPKLKGGAKGPTALVHQICGLM